MGDRLTITEERILPGLSDRLLAARCCRPRLRPGRVPRPRLLQRLDQAAGGAGRLILVSAPAGYGKTTLLSEWASAAGPRTAWLSLEEGDDSFVRFWTCLAAALGMLQPNLGERTRSLLQGQGLWNAAEIVTVLVDEIGAFPGGFTLVLDDYQSIHSPEVHRSLQSLLTHLPSGVCLAISTRSDPPLALAQLRARNELEELRAADLRFSLEETGAFLTGVMGLGLSPEGVAALAARTEGWIAGLQLAALSLQGREDPERFIQAFTGSHRFILDYLSEQVLGRLPADRVSFLLETSILEQLNAAMCSALTGRADSQAILEDLEQQNIFLVPLDDERACYRYHPLFAEFLRHRLQALRPDPTAQLHQQASRWYEADGSVPQAVQHALAAKEYERAAGLMEEAAGALVRQGEGEHQVNWLEALPGPVRRQHPALCLASGRSSAERMEVSRVEKWLAEAEEALAGLAPGAGREAGLDGQAAALRAFLSAARQELQPALQFAGQAEALLPGGDASWRGFVALTLARVYGLRCDWIRAGEACLNASALSQSAGHREGALLALSLHGEALEAQGSLRHAVQQYEQVLRLAEAWGLSQAPGIAVALAGLGRVWFEWNDLDRASSFLVPGLERSRRGGSLDAVLSCLLSLAQICLVREGLVEALAGLEEASAAALQLGIPGAMERVAALQVRVQLAQPALLPGSGAGQAGGLGVTSGDPFLPEMAIARARLLLAGGRLAEGISLMEQALQDAETDGRVGNEIQILVVAAGAQRSQGNSEQALALLGRALALGEPEGYVRVFIDEGEPVMRLLRRFAASDSRSNYARRLLEAMGMAREATPSGPTSLVETLTGREAEILKLIVDGATNRQIADELVLTVNTVKKHTSHIYGKLGVATRTQAAARALYIL
jgi:LuxR family maltose regulon positive regulatory protein